MKLGIFRSYIEPVGTWHKRRGALIQRVAAMADLDGSSFRHVRLVVDVPVKSAFPKFGGSVSIQELNLVNVWSAARLQGKSSWMKKSLRQCIRPLGGAVTFSRSEARRILT
jgi:hypothetical protein